MYSEGIFVQDEDVSARDAQRTETYVSIEEHATDEVMGEKTELDYHMFSSGICSKVGSSGSSRSTVRMYWLNSSRMACLV